MALVLHFFYRHICHIAPLKSTYFYEPSNHMTNWKHHLLSFYNSLQPLPELPEGYSWLFPQGRPEVMEVVERFLHLYYNDSNPRTLLLGINPGRFGAGVTGVNFTAPRQLQQVLGIQHPFRDQSELSAEFIYAMIGAFGGPAAFYSRFFIGSVCPLGFVKDGKNINYYDDPLLLKSVEPFIRNNLSRLLEADVNREEVFSIGGEKNFKYLEKINRETRWFHQVTPLPHPRYIMQYKRKEMQQFIRLYLQFITKNGDPGFPFQRFS